MLGVLQLASTVIVTGFVIFWKPIVYMMGWAFVWAIIFSLLCVQERQLKTTLFQNKVKIKPADPSVAKIYTVVTSVILAGLWPGLPILIWYDYGTDEEATRSRGTARDL